ncbi:MAG: MFS transporter, partial [Planctomycetes bacterium]|nr:MFS transporter [Planctomycetota bacterium]
MSQESSLALEKDLAPARIVGTAFVVVLLGHAVVDALAALVPATLGLLEVRVGMTAQQSAWLLGLGPLCSGLAQPICAVVSDRRNTRLLGVVGVALGALGIGTLGLAADVTSLALIYALGMIGIGMFHPVGATTIGYLRSHNRNTAVSLFFVAGMIGGVSGALLWPRVLSMPQGFRYLPLAILPAAALTALMFSGPTAAQVDAMDVDELLERVRQGSARDNQAEAARLRTFEQNQDQQERLLQEARNERAAEERRSDQLETTFESNELLIADVTAQLDSRLCS